MTSGSSRGSSSSPCWRWSLFVVSWLWDNLQVNSERQNIPTSFDYLDQPAGFPIAEQRLPPDPAGPRRARAWACSTRCAWRSTGIVLATVLGTLIGVARLSKNFLVRKGAQVVRRDRSATSRCSGSSCSVYLAVVLNVFPRSDDSLGARPARRAQVRGRSLFVVRGRDWKFVVVVVAARRSAVGRRPLATARVADRTGRRRARPAVGARHRRGRARGRLVALGLGVDRPGARRAPVTRAASR